MRSARGQYYTQRIGTPQPLREIFLKIAHIHSSPGHSGGEVQVLLLLTGLRQRGIASTLFHLPGSACGKRAASLGIPTLPLAPRNAADFPGMWRLRHALRSGKFDVVHAHTGHAIWMGSMAARPLKIPVVATKRMDRPIRRGLKSYLIWRRWVAAAVGISPAVVQQLRQANVPESRLHLICSVVDPARATAQRSRVALRHELATPANATALLALGSLDYRKGLDVLLAACSLWPADAPPIHLWIAGDGPERQSLTEQARCLPPTIHIQFLGQRSDPADLLAASDIVVMPSRAEGMGNTALEAMASERPIVASAVGGLAHSIIPEETGLLVPPENPAALRAALLRLVRDPALRHRFARAGQTRVTTTFTPTAMVESYLSLYHRLIPPSPSYS